MKDLELLNTLDASKPLDDGIRRAEDQIRVWVEWMGVRHLPIGKIIREVVYHEGKIMRIEWWVET